MPEWYTCLNTLKKQGFRGFWQAISNAFLNDRSRVRVAPGALGYNYCQTLTFSVPAVLPYVAPPVAAMIRLQMLTATRPGEIVVMRAIDIDMSGDVWVYEPHTHKNRWRGHRRQIMLGPKAKAIIRPFLDRPTDALQCPANRRGP